jgi:prepilin-type N-terminal cleavage/methylation domain-containing protein
LVFEFIFTIISQKLINKKMKQCGSEKSFTLTEVLVVIAIIGFLTAIILPNFRAGEKQFALQRAAHELAQDIRRVQEMAMSAKECGECGGATPAGYGIIFDIGWDDKKYILYADTQPPQGNEFYTPADTIIEPPYIELEKGVYIQAINTPPNKVGINFKPPDPETKIKYQESGGEIDEAIITLSLETDPAKTKLIKVNKAGLIYAE